MTRTREEEEAHNSISAGIFLSWKRKLCLKARQIKPWLWLSVVSA